MINFEETELRLGLPGNESSTTLKGSGAKRGFSQTSASVDLKLNLSSSNNDPASDSPSSLSTDNTTTAAPADPAKPPAKSQVVGWPPVRSFRKNIVSRKNGNEEEEKNGNGGGCLVKVSMDGAPYLRKVDIHLYKSYQQLSDSLAKMFSSFTIGNSASGSGSQQDTKFNGSDYVPTYQDKDGDWMLVGDVPWEMFLESCKRLRIMKASEAIGLAPRAGEKYKTRS